MNKLLVFPSRISGTVRAPPSKSETHREFILSALADGTSVITHPLLSEDTLATLDGIRAFGAKVCLACNTVSITGGHLHAADGIIDCKNSGSTLRMLIAVAACFRGTTRFTGDVSLMRRPMNSLFTALEVCGAVITREENVIRVTGPIVPKMVDIAGNISSQFISALLIAGCSVHLTTPLVSAPYVAMTISALERRGVSVMVSNDTYVREYRPVIPVSVYIDGDWSSAAYLLAAGALAGTVTVTGLSFDTVQGDKLILEILEKMGVAVSCSKTAVTVSSRPLHAITCNLNATPDLVPIVAVLAAHADGVSRISGVSHLAYKESDRLQGVFDLLSAFGISVTLSSDGFRIHGGRIHGSRISVSNDHRMFMSAVIAGFAASGSTEIEDSPDAAMVSYPAFLHDVRTLGGICRR